jgi:(4S)-4-hydroxy-5-phosphonooxypentane-2,3-dione isomerase
MSPIAFMIHITMKPERADEFLKVAEEDARQSALEPGNLRFEIYRQEEDPLKLVVLEMYRDQAALEAHRATSYVAAWRQAVTDCTTEYTRIFMTPFVPEAETYV